MNIVIRTTILLLMLSSAFLLACGPSVGPAVDVQSIEEQVVTNIETLQPQLRGSQGEPGPEGLTGPQGEPGPQGATGPQGASAGSNISVFSAILKADTVSSLKNVSACELVDPAYSSEASYDLSYSTNNSWLRVNQAFICGAGYVNPEYRLMFSSLNLEIDVSQLPFNDLNRCTISIQIGELANGTRDLVDYYLSAKVNNVATGGVILKIKPVVPPLRGATNPLYFDTSKVSHDVHVLGICPN